MSLPPAAPRRFLPWHQVLLADRPRTLRALTTLLLGVWIAWSIGSSGYGALQSAMALALLLSTATGFGLDTLVKKELRKNPAESASTLGTAMALRCGAGVLVYVGLLLFTSSHQATPQSIWLVAGLILLTQTPLLLGLRLEDAGHGAHVVRAGYIGFFLSAAIATTLVLRDADAVWFACAFVLEQPLTALVLLYWHGKIAPDEEAFTWEWATARTWLRQCLPLWRATLLPLLLVPVSQLVVIARSSPGQAGRFAIATLVFEFGLFCALTLIASRAAATSRDDAAADEALSNTAERQNALQHAAAVGWLCALAVVAVGVGLGFTVLKQSFGDLALVSTLVGLSIVPFSLGAVRDEIWATEKKQVLRARARLIAAGVNVVACWFFASFFGAAGAAGTLLFSATLGEMLMTFASRSERALAATQLKAAFFKARPAAPKPLPSSPAAADAGEVRQSVEASPKADADAYLSVRAHSNTLPAQVGS